VVQELETIIGRDEPEVVEQALYALATIGPAAAHSVPLLATMLRQGNRAIERSAAAYALKAIGPAAEEAVSALIERLTDGSLAVRQNAIGALGAIGPGAAVALPAIVRLSTDPLLKPYAECATRLITRRFEYDESMAWQSALPQFSWPRPSLAGQLALK
jgi:HEAT repeat protein